MNMSPPLKDIVGELILHAQNAMLSTLMVSTHFGIRQQYHQEVKAQVTSDSNLWLDNRLHLYRARAYLLLHEAEASVEAAREFFRDVVDCQSPHRTNRAYELLEELETAGYGGVKDVQDFREELRQARTLQRKKGML